MTTQQGIRTAPAPEPKDESGTDQVIDGPVVYTGPVVVTVRGGRTVITEGGEVVFDSDKHKRQVINGPVTYKGGYTLNVGGSDEPDERRCIAQVVEGPTAIGEQHFNVGRGSSDDRR